MPVRIRRIHILGERKFKTGILEALLKFLELIRRPHLGDTKYIRMNLLNDPNQRILFALRLGSELGPSALAPVHFEIVLDVVVNEFYRLLSINAFGQQHEHQYERVPGEHTKRPARRKLATHPRLASPQSCAHRAGEISEFILGRLRGLLRGRLRLGGLNWSNLCYLNRLRRLNLLNRLPLLIRLSILWCNFQILPSLVEFFVKLLAGFPKLVHTLAQTPRQLGKLLCAEQDEYDHKDQHPFCRSWRH